MNAENKNNETQDQGDALRNGLVITDIDEVCAAIRATRNGVSMFSGTFGPGGLQGKFVTPNS